MKSKGTRKLFVALISVATLCGCRSAAQPAETPKPTHVIWTVSPEEGVFDAAEDVQILNGAVDWFFMSYRGLIGYPSQWASEAYSPDVLKVQMNGEYTLYTYEGERLFEDTYKCIGNYMGPQGIMDTSNRYPFERISVSDDVLLRWIDGDTEGTEPYVDFNVLSEDYRSIKEEYLHAPQYGDLGVLPKVNFIQGKDQLEDSNGKTYSVAEAEDSIYTTNGYDLRTPLDYVFPVENENEETVAYRVIRNDGTVGEEIPNEVAGVMINGVLPVFNRTPDANSEGYGSRNNKGDLYGVGTAAEGSAIGLYNAYTDEMISDFAYEAVGVTEEGYVPVKEAGKWGLYSIENKTLVIPCILDDITSVYNGMVYIEIDGRKGVLNLGETLAAGVEINEETLAEVVVEETAAPEV